MICPERLRLANEYYTKGRYYSEQKRRVVDLMGLGVSAEMGILCEMCRKASEAVQNARLALYLHEANHFCDRNDFDPNPVPKP